MKKLLSKKFIKELSLIILICWVIAPMTLLFLLRSLPRPSDELMTSAPHIPAFFVSAEMAKKWR